MLLNTIVTALLCVAAASRSVDAAETGPLGVAREGLRIEPDAKGRFLLGDVLKRFEAVGDWKLVIDEETRALADSVSLWASGPIEAGPESVPLVVDALLANASFAWTILPGESPLQLEVRTRDAQRRSGLAERAPVVPPDELGRYSEHAALLVRTRVSLPGSDVRTISNSMRALIADPAILNVVPAADSADLEITGSARAVAELVHMLRLVDSPASEAPQEAKPVPFPSSDESATLLPAEVGGRKVLLLALVQEYARTTGQVAVINEEPYWLLSNTDLALDAPLSASGAEFGALAEARFTESNYVVVELLRDAPRLCAIHSLDTTARGTVRTSARFVDAGSVPDCARRPATLVVTVARFPHLGARSVANAMRAEIEDPNVQMIIPVGNSSSLLLLARGKTLADTLAKLRAMDDEAARASAPKGR